MSGVKTGSAHPANAGGGENGGGIGRRISDLGGAGGHCDHTTDHPHCDHTTDHPEAVPATAGYSGARPLPYHV
jgi:hypothetical protein